MRFYAKTTGKTIFFRFFSHSVPGVSALRRQPVAGKQRLHHQNSDRSVILQKSNRLPKKNPENLNIARTRRLDGHGEEKQ